MNGDVIAFLQRTVRPLVLCHTSPDGDAIGSLLGMGWLLQRLGKTPTLACADPVPSVYRFLPGQEAITDKPSGSFDAVIALDASDAARLGTTYTPALQTLPLLVIDHHVTNLRYGAVNWIDTQAASTAEMVLLLCDALGLSPDREAATCLLTGVVTDTRGFRTSNTAPRSLDVARRLMEAGADMTDIAQRTLEARPLAMLNLWARALTSLELRGAVLSASITEAMRAECRYDGDDNGGLVNLLIAANEANIAAVFTERTKDAAEVEVSIRAKPGIDVSKVALELGGGGHPQAAGARIAGSLADVRPRVVSMLQNVVAGRDGASSSR